MVCKYIQNYVICINTLLQNFENWYYLLDVPSEHFLTTMYMCNNGIAKKDIFSYS